MITNNEKEALLRYLEFLLVKQLLEPVIDKHVGDPDVIGASYDVVYDILKQLERDIETYREDRKEELKGSS